jgi:hypothetical protein
VLSDEDRRIQYDLKLLGGVQYDIPPAESEVEKYGTRPFQMFMMSRKFKVHFAAVLQVRVHLSSDPGTLCLNSLPLPIS